MVEKQADVLRQETGGEATVIPERWPIDPPAPAVPTTWLRQADPPDRDFAAALYLESMRIHLTRLGKWDERRVRRRFQKSFRTDQSRIIHLGDMGIGWLQVSETADCLHLHQIHILERFRNRGIGGNLIAGLLRRAQATSRPVALNVIRGNPAISLYKRLGFRPAREDAEKVLMRWEPDRRQSDRASASLSVTRG